MKKNTPPDIRNTVNRLARQWHCPVHAGPHRKLVPAGQKAIRQILEDLIAALFPGCHGTEVVPVDELKPFFLRKLRDTARTLAGQIRRAHEYQCRFDRCEGCMDCRRRADEVVTHLMNSLPVIQDVLQEDIVAAYEGDPAARSTLEVVMSYPGLYAIIVHRIAHLLYADKVPLIPRIMSESAHSLTGIDIHPGAVIGPGFFIDHGTGVVIGETCVIGRKVKLYQGVTLGALSFEKDAQGRLVKGVKRHPNVEDNVIIYAGATILGGQTTIGANSEIGGNVWLIHSVPPFSKVYNQQPPAIIRQAGQSLKTPKRRRRP